MEKRKNSPAPDTDRDENDRALCALCALLRHILEGRFEEAANCRLGGECGESAALLLRLCNDLAQLSDYTRQLSLGNLSTAPPPRTNFLAMSAKNLHAKLNHLVWQLNQVATGDYSQVVDYMGDLAHGFNWMTQQLKLRQMQAAYEFNHDPFTGLLNRKAFMRAVFDVIADQPNKKGVLLFCGLDNLKSINNTHGHEIGDKYILAASDALLGFGGGTILAARISGDEFAIYTHGCDNLDEVLGDIQTFAEKELGKTHYTLDGVCLNLRVSTGVAVYPDDAGAADELIKYASHAMFQVKQHDRGRVERFDNREYREKSRLYGKQDALDRLIEEQRIRFAFQPIVHMRTGAIYGYEALMRSTMPEFSSPLEILEIAKSHAKTAQVERLTIQTAFAWLDEHLPLLGDRKFFFNMSSARFLDAQEMERLHPGFARLLNNIVFEILEEAADEDAFIKNVAIFRNEFGTMIAIDDYGCGYSNDFRLLNLAPDLLKVDRFFIKDLHRNKDKQIILSNIISFCASKNIRVLAEGVETEEELRTVARLGFDFAQGFYLALPQFELLQHIEEAKREVLRACQ